MKRFVFLTLVLSLFSISLSAQELPTLNFQSSWSDSEFNIHDNPYDETPVLSMEEAIKFSRRNNFEARVDALRVYRAKKQVQVRVGQLLPSFNMRFSLFTGAMIAAFPLSLLEYVPNLLGFLFPSNWFRLSESKFYAKASEQSFYSLMANQINATENLYYNIHQQNIDLKIYQNHYAFVLKLVEIMQVKYEQGLVPLEELKKSELYLSEIAVNLINIEGTVGELSPQLGFALDLPVEWDDFKLKRLPVPDMDKKNKLEFDFFKQEVFEKSPELKALGFLGNAAKASKRARYFDFLSPGSGTDSAFGFGYVSSINIGRADQEIVKVQTEQMEANLKETLYRTINTYNTSLELFKQASRALNTTDFVINSMIDLLYVDSSVDFFQFRELLLQNIYFQSIKNMAIHGYYVALANLHRLLLSSKHYANLEQLLPVKKGKLKCFQRVENRKIQRLIKNGEIKFEEPFTKEELKFCFGF